MFRRQYTIFREFTVVLAKVVNYYNDKIQCSSVLFLKKILVNVAACVRGRVN